MSSSITVVQQDSVGNYTANMSATNTLFGTANGLENVASGHSLIVVVSAQRADNQVTSITDNFGNEYTQIPRALVQYDAEQGMCDIWWSPNITGGAALELTVNLSGTANNSIYGWNVVVLEVEGINGDKSPSLVGTMTQNNGSDVTAPFVGPGFSTTSEALFVAAFHDNNGSQHGTPRSTPASVSSPWSSPFASGASQGHGCSWVDAYFTASLGTTVAVYIGEGSQQPTFTTSNPEAGVEYGMVTVAVFVAGAPGAGISQPARVMRRTIISRPSPKTPSASPFRGVVPALVPPYKGNIFRRK